MLTEVLFVAVGGPSIGGEWEQWKRGSLKYPARARRDGVSEQSFINTLYARELRNQLRAAGHRCGFCSTCM